MVPSCPRRPHAASHAWHVKELAVSVTKVNDVVVGNPLVIKLVISYNRSGRGGHRLRELLGPLIKQVRT